MTTSTLEPVLSTTPRINCQHLGCLKRATWCEVWRSPAMPASAFSYTCDEHRTMLASAAFIELPAPPRGATPQQAARRIVRIKRYLRRRGVPNEILRAVSDSNALLRLALLLGRAKKQAGA